MSPQTEDPSEWAMRWDATNRPEGLAELAAKLSITGAKQTFRVRYARVIAPAAPEGYGWVVRERAEPDGKTKLTYKLRGPAPLPQWLPAEEGAKTSREWDATVLERDEVRFVYSHAWTTKRTRLPDGWRLGDWTTAVPMVRQKVDDGAEQTIEDWLAGGRRYIEVSRRGRAGSDDRLGFLAWTGLVAAGAVRLATGMAQIVLGELGT